MRLAVDQPFDLAATLECGQGHRWKKTDGGWYEGVMGADVVLIKQRAVHGALEFDCELDEAQMATRLHRHFRLDDDIEAIYADLRKRDGKMSELVERYPGMRVMRIDPWECLVFFILSAGTDIKRIQGNMENLSNKFGAAVNLSGSQRCAFPTPEQLSEVGETELKRLIVGFNRNATATYRTIMSVQNGCLSIAELRKMTYERATKELTKMYGIGSKIANCVALFSLGELKAFPIDRHIFRALDKLYGNNAGFPKVNRLDERSYPRLLNWAQDYFGPYAGYASQFLFINDYKSRST